MTESLGSLIADKEALSEKVKALTEELKIAKKELKEKVELVFTMIKEDNERKKG